MNKDEYNYQDSGSIEQSTSLLQGASHSVQPCSAASHSLWFFYQQVKGLNIWIHNAADWFQNVERHWARFLFVRYFLPFSFLVRDVQGKEVGRTQAWKKSQDLKVTVFSYYLYEDCPEQNPQHRSHLQLQIYVCNCLLEIYSWLLHRFMQFRISKTKFIIHYSKPATPPSSILVI